MPGKSDAKRGPGLLSAFVLAVFAVIVSFILNFFSERMSLEVSPYLGVPFLLMVLALGVLADVVGIACTRAREPSLLSMASRKVRGARESLWFVRNAGLVSSLANDLLGDVCSTVAGGLAVGLSFRFASDLGLKRSLLSALVVGLAAGVAVGGKALMKGVGLKRAESIVHKLGLLASILGKGLSRRDSQGGSDRQAGTRPDRRRQWG